MKNKLPLVAVLLSLIFIGCGKGIDTDQKSLKPEPQKELCTLMGNIRSFEIKCSEQIESFTLYISGGVEFTYNEHLIIRTRLNGLHYNTFIENKGTSVVGSEGIQDQIKLSINFTDSSIPPVTFNLAP
ncbi:MAG: hypothetical protein ACO3A2_04725 [Bdellovibrionia bacterium]